MQAVSENNARSAVGASNELATRVYVIGERGELEVDLASYQLRQRSGEVVPLEPKAFDVLVYLIESRERVVPSKELFAKFWPPHISPTVLSHYVVVARKAIGDDVERQSMILTVRGRGYRFIGYVAEQSESKVRESMVAPRVPRELLLTGKASGNDDDGDLFIGRTEQLDRLEGALGQAIDGQGRAVVVAGDAGVGKSRLLAELGERARARGVRVLAGGCGPEHAALAIFPPSQLSDRNGSGEIDELARFRLFDAIAGFLRATSQEQPILLMFDDVHGADSASLALLKHLIQKLEGTRALIVIALGEPRDTAVLAGSFARSERLALAGWTPAETAEALAAAGGGSCAADTAQRVHELTDGHPRLVRELARVLAARLTPA